MILIHKIIKTYLLVLATLATVTISKAQTPGEQKLDPSGFVTKYDPDFNGIGPKVYVLPAPRTKKEELADSYKEKTNFYDSISKQLDFQNLIEGYKSTSNKGFILQNIKPLPATDAEWEALILKLHQNNNQALSVGIANEYALELIRKGELSKAIAVLGTGMNGTTLDTDWSVLQFNLANTFLLNGNNKEAIAIQETFLRNATINRNLNDQADILVGIAISQAHGKNYRAAENTIIRRAIPLYNKIKDAKGKVNAWTTLARIYQVQNKHTEAQWFLIQARDLALTRDYGNDLAEMEYMLGYSKYIQQNYKVAKLEMENARSMASLEKNKILQLAISDKLGDIYLKLGYFKEAETALEDYWRLRREIFPKSDVDL